ncbi:MAG: hypothetical protein LBM93_10125 [Oscillospiraceae bacterium]|jgi:hypothetical protein|nr:hypothetical protein [Oscillospiraceae bacterium]
MLIKTAYLIVALPDPTKLSVTVKSVTPTTAKIYLERTSGEAKGALSYVLLKGNYSETDFSKTTISDMKNHPDFVFYQISKWQ